MGDFWGANHGFFLEMGGNYNSAIPGALVCGYNKQPTIGDVITCDYDKSKLNIYSKGTITAVATGNYSALDLKQDTNTTNVIGGVFKVAHHNPAQNIANVKFGFFSIFNRVLTTAERQTMEGI